MGMWVGRGRKARRCYGFDEIALVPREVTINPDEVDCSWTIKDRMYQVPILAAAMDGVVDVRFAIEMGRLGGIAVLNLEGVQTRYRNPDEVLERIAKATPDEATGFVQGIYREPINEKLISTRIEQIKKGGAPAVVSTIPQRAERFGGIAQEAGADMFVVQSTVTTVKHLSTAYETLDFAKLCKAMKIPVIVGNTCSYSTALELMETGIDALLVGIGPGAACTTRGVLGIGVPQVTATCDCAAARDTYFLKTRRYVPIITDGGMRSGGDVCKALAAGADAVMMGSIFAGTKESPGQGYSWGMSTGHAQLPRGTRIRVGVNTTLERLLFGPTSRTDGTENLVGAIRSAMGMCGAQTIHEFHNVELIVAPSIKTEGKKHQLAQQRR